MEEWEQEGRNLRKKLRERLDQTREVKDQEIYRQIDDLILEETRNRYVSLGEKRRFGRSFSTASGNWISCRN